MSSYFKLFPFFKNVLIVSIFQNFTISHQFPNFNFLNFSNPDWRQRFAVQFRNQERTEAGIGEGVNVEFLEDLLRTGFDPNLGLFLQNENGELYPNPGAIYLYPDSYRQHYK